MSKKPVEHEDDEPEEKPTTHRPAAHPEHDLPKPAKPDHLPAEKAPEKPPLVGVVHFQDASGGDNGSATYNVPMSLRDRVLVWRHKQHEQNHQNENGEWVYRQTHTAGAGDLEHDAELEPIEDVSA